MDPLTNYLESAMSRTLVLIIALILGLGGSSLPAADADADKPAATAVSIHGGVIREVGDDTIELVHDAVNGSLTIYLVSEDKKPFPIPRFPLPVQVKIPGAAALAIVLLNAKPQEGDPTDKASVFAGTDAALIGKTDLTVILRIELDDKQQRVVFMTGKPGHE